MRKVNRSQEGLKVLGNRLCLIDGHGDVHVCTFGFSALLCRIMWRIMVKTSFTCSRCTLALAQRNTLMSPASMTTNNDSIRQRQCGTCLISSSNCLLLACPTHKDSSAQLLGSIKGGEHVGRPRVPARLRGPWSAPANPLLGPGIPSMKHGK